MSVDDVDLIPQRTIQHVNSVVQPSKKRLTFQHFNNSDIVVNDIAPHNSDARISDSEDWPPPLIFDVAYGCAALKTWGVPAFLNFSRTQTRNIYYNNNNRNENGDGRGRSGDSKSEKRRQQKQDCQERAIRWENRCADQEAGNTAAQEPDVADIILTLWMQNARKGQHQAHAMKADRNREKVEGWLESVEESSESWPRNYPGTRSPK